MTSRTAWRERVAALLVEVLGGSGDRAPVAAAPALTA
jgi:hypothetical protein